MILHLIAVNGFGTWCCTWFGCLFATWFGTLFGCLFAALQPQCNDPPMPCMYVLDMYGTSGLLYCMEYLEDNLHDWLGEELEVGVGHDSGLEFMFLVCALQLGSCL